MNKFVGFFLVVHCVFCLVFSFTLLPMVMDQFQVQITQDEYDDIGWNLAQGKGFTAEHGEESVIRGPAYPLFLSIIYSVFGHNYDAVQVVQALLSALNVFLAYVLVRQLHSEVVARLATVIMALNPFLVWYAARLMVETLFMTTVLLVFLASWYLVKRPSLQLAVITGICFASAAYIKSLMLVMPLAVFLILLITGKSLVSSLNQLVIVVLTMAVCILPWTIRNYVVTDGEIIPVHASLALPLTQSYLYCENFAESPLDASSSFAQTNEKLKEITAAAGYDPFHYPLHSLESELRIESAARKYFGELYSRDPGLYVGHTGIRMLLFWYYSTQPIFSVVWMIFNGLLIALFLPGLASSGPLQARFVTVWVVLFWLIHAAIIASARFTLPLHPLMLSVALPFLIFLLPGIKRIPFLVSALDTGRFKPDKF